MNTYVEFGNIILRQIKGISMGSITAPDFANASLAVDEYRFVKDQLKCKNYQLLEKFNYLCRYLDDIGVPNLTNFDVYAATIYSNTLSLTKSNDNSLNEVAFLDLPVSVEDSRFHTKVYCKTDNYQFQVITLPFLSSNVAEEMCFYVYFGQILRFLCICTKLEYFKDRCLFLTRLLQDRGYSNVKLASKFNQVLHRHRMNWNKFAGQVRTRDLMLSVVYAL